MRNILFVRRVREVLDGLFTIGFDFSGHVHKIFIASRVDGTMCVSPCFVRLDGLRARFLFVDVDLDLWCKSWWMWLSWLTQR